MSDGKPGLDVRVEILRRSDGTWVLVGWPTGSGVMSNTTTPSATTAKTPTEQFVTAVTAMRELIRTEDGFATFMVDHLAEKASRPNDAGVAMVAKGAFRDTPSVITRLSAAFERTLQHVSVNKIEFVPGQTEFIFSDSKGRIRYVFEMGVWKFGR